MIVPSACYPVAYENLVVNPTDGESLIGDSPGARYLSLTRTLRSNPKASKFLRSGSPGSLPVTNENLVFNPTGRESLYCGSCTLLPACYLSLTRTRWHNLTASEFLHDGSPVCCRPAISR
jgi:hypothetical protein